MAEMKRPRHLYPEEVEVMNTANTAKGAMCAVYKNARTDMVVLDEMYPGDWEDSYERIGDTLFCKVTIHTDKGPRTFTDVGTESNTEAIKGEASSAFKRACTKVGIGRGLYTLPPIFISASKLGCDENKDAVKEAFRKARIVVADIEFGHGRAGEYCKFIELVSAKTGEIVYSWTSKRTELSSVTPELATLKELLVKAKMAEEKVLKEYNVSSLNIIATAPELYKNCVERLERRALALAKKRQEELENLPADEGITESEPVDDTEEDDPLNAHIDAENGDDSKPSGYGTLVVASPDAPPNLSAYNGQDIESLPLNVIKELSRKNSKLRVFLSNDSVNAIDLRAEDLRREAKKKK